MKREEAIYQIKQLAVLATIKEMSSVTEALNMAIDALQEPKTIIGIDIPYGSDKGIATVFKGKDDKLILEKVKEICLDVFADRPTVIRSKTLMPTKDFKEWAKRVGETNPNAVVIPCDAEVVSAVTVPKGEWIGLDECSVCGKQAYDFIEGCVEGVEYLPNFCPNCGSIMYKGGDSE